MKKTLSLILILITLTSCSQKPFNSPNGKIKVEAIDSETSGVSFNIFYQDGSIADTVMTISNLGLDVDSVACGVWHIKDFVENPIVEDYTMLTGKKRVCHNEANERVYSLADDKGNEIQFAMRAYNDGVAYRYILGKTYKEGMLTAEHTTYSFPEKDNRWLMRWSDAYEGFYPKNPEEKVDEHLGYPGLFEVGTGIYTLISEGNMEKGHSASAYYPTSEPSTYRISPDKMTSTVSAGWQSPWRLAIVGDMQAMLSSTLVTDVSDPNKLEDTSWIEPGVVSWIYWAYNHGSNDYNIIKMYIDFAKEMNLPYMLIDAEWDEMKDGKTIEDCIQYAHELGIKPLIWYNSSIGWVDGAPGPKYRMNKPEDMEKEFAWLDSLGVAGVKVDFWAGDEEKATNLHIAVLECAAKHHLLVNFHGATIPRGWQRTYPNLMSTEAVLGAEWYNNAPFLTPRAACHNATIPYTRGVIGSMDYTPCTFTDSQHPHITSNAHELALTVLFESGLLHLADRPSGYLSQPKEVQSFLSNLPTVWDELRYLGGYPGEDVILARRDGDIWYVAGINGTDEPRTLKLNTTDFVKEGAEITLFEDNANAEDSVRWTISNVKVLPDSIATQPRGGFVAVIK